MAKKQSHEIFGISNEILIDTYVDRGDLDRELNRRLTRRQHIALCGESKCGKSWLRQKAIPNALVVQCRYGKKVSDIYIDALSQLGIILTIEEAHSDSIKGKVEAQGEVGLNLIAKLRVKMGLETTIEDSKKGAKAGHDVNDLRFISDLIKESERRLVIEDFHYLNLEERKSFAYDLKAMWDYGLFVVIIGVWNQSNLLIYLNQDLSTRIFEILVRWTKPELQEVLEKGADKLNITFTPQTLSNLVSNSFNNVGLLQQLTMLLLDEVDVFEEQSSTIQVGCNNSYEAAAMKHAEQLNPLYQQFAKRVSSGIRKRKESTGIHAHAMAVIVDAEDTKLIEGLHVQEIFDIAHSRQKRIQISNLKKVLRKFEELQVDEDGRGLVLAYNDAIEEISAVDRQLLFYRKYSTVNWPWEELIKESEISPQS